MPLATGPLPGLNDQEPGILPLAAGVRLQADAGIASSLAEPSPKLPVEGRVALQLVGGGKGVEFGELGPGDRDHLAGCVEFHRATAQRDHAAVECQILVAQLADVSKHAGFAVMRVEDRMRQEVRRPPQAGRNERLDALLVVGQIGQGLPGRREDHKELREIVAGGRLIERDRERAGVERAQVHAEFAGPRGDARGAVARLEGERVEGMGIPHLDAKPRKPVGHNRRVGRDAQGDSLEAGRPMVNGVHACHDCG